jgi:hypothetical protein
MYMNCAPVTLTASASKRSIEDQELWERNYTMLMERDTAAFNALPNMFVANIPTSSCETQDSKDVVFPDPGDSLEQFGLSTSATATPTGPSCGAAVVATGGASSATGGASSAAASKATTSAAVVASSSPAASGGVFATVASSAGASQATSAPAASSTPVASAVSSAKASTQVASSSTPASTGSTGTTGTSSAITAGTACTTEGEWNCIGGTAYQQCASGTWSVEMQLAAGTSCTAGESTNINITASKKGKRSVRFSGSHLRRHLQKS